MSIGYNILLQMTLTLIYPALTCMPSLLSASSHIEPHLLSRSSLSVLLQFVLDRPGTFLLYLATTFQYSSVRVSEYAVRACIPLQTVL